MLAISEVNSKTLEFLKYKLLDLTAHHHEISWLDVGCGNGRCIDVLDVIQNRGCIRYHGIDSSYKYLDDAEKCARRYDLNARFDKTDAAAMKFDSMYDVVSAVLFLHETDPLCLPYVLRNMLRALKIDGTLVISDFQGPYELERDVVAWHVEDIEYLLNNVGVTGIAIELKPSEQYPTEFGFYCCYIKKPKLSEKRFDKLLKAYGDFLKAKKEESKQKRNELRSQIEERVREILGRSDIDANNISEEEMNRVLTEIGDEYSIIKMRKIRILANQIEFLDDKIEDFNKGHRCAGVD